MPTLPRRTRGIVLGLLTLVMGPILAASAVPPIHAATTIHGDIVQAGAHMQPVIPELAERYTPTPAPTPVPTPRPVHHIAVPNVNWPPGSVEAIIMAAAAKYGVDGNWMIRIGECESGLRPNAVSRNGLYFGVFQFLQSTFAAHGGTNIFDPAQQADITANMLAHGGARAWPVCSLR